MLSQTVPVKNKSLMVQPPTACRIIAMMRSVQIVTFKLLIYLITMGIGSHVITWESTNTRHIYELCVMHKYPLHVNLKWFHLRLYKRASSCHRV